MLPGDRLRPQCLCSFSYRWLRLRRHWLTLGIKHLIMVAITITIIIITAMRIVITAAIVRPAPVLAFLVPVGVIAMALIPDHGIPVIVFIPIAVALINITVAGVITIHNINAVTRIIGIAVGVVAAIVIAAVVAITIRVAVTIGVAIAARVRTATTIDIIARTGC